MASVSGMTSDTIEVEALGDDMTSMSSMTSDMIYGFGEDRFSPTIMMMIPRIPRFILRDDDYLCSIAFPLQITTTIAFATYSIYVSPSFTSTTKAIWD